MPVFGSGSRIELLTCHVELQRVAVEGIKHYDFKVIQGHRGEVEQHAAFLAKTSQLDWPHGKHNRVPSDAMDVMPWPVDWSDAEKNVQRSVLLAGILLACGWQLGIALRWGGDWNRDGDTRNERFRDYGHFERTTP